MNLPEFYLFINAFQAVQLIVHIARSDWPDRYPDFFNNILALVSSVNLPSRILGLLFLQTASEELGTPRDDLLSGRKSELKQRMLQLVPQILSLLSGNLFFIYKKKQHFIWYVLLGLLESIWEKQSHSITSTPPPSPTNSSAFNSVTNHLAAGSTTPSLNSEFEPIIRLALQCLTHLFSWIPLSSHVTPQLMELVFRFVGLGTQPSMSQFTSGKMVFSLWFNQGVVYNRFVLHTQKVAFQFWLSVPSTKCCIKIAFQLNLKTLLSYYSTTLVLFCTIQFITLPTVIYLIQLIHSKSKSILLTTRLFDYVLLYHFDCRFVEKFVELIHLLVTSHLRRLEGRSLPAFSVPQFLSLFFNFTFEQNDWNRYSSCLDTWQVFLDHVKQSSGASGDQDFPAMRYHESLVTLSERVLHKVLFFYNGSELSELDDEATDGNVFI